MISLDIARAKSNDPHVKKFRFTIKIGSIEGWMRKEEVEQILDEVEQALAEDGALKRERRALGVQGRRTARALGRGVKALLDPKPKKRRK
jgi:hypothetical protein